MCWWSNAWHHSQHCCAARHLVSLGVLWKVLAQSRLLTCAACTLALLIHLVPLGVCVLEGCGMLLGTVCAGRLWWYSHAYPRVLLCTTHNADALLTPLALSRYTLRVCSGLLLRTTRNAGVLLVHLVSLGVCAGRLWNTALHSVCC